MMFKDLTLVCSSLLCLGLSAACQQTREPRPRRREVVFEKPVETSPEVARTPLGERLSEERGNRPAARQQVDDALSTLGQLSIDVVRRRQVLAAPLGADYCENGLSAAGLGFSLCAFADPAAALRGKSVSQHSFDQLIPNRALLVDGAVLLTLLPSSASSAMAERQRVLASFAALSQARASL